MAYNPNSPCTVGLEWRPTRTSVGMLDSDNKAIGFILRAATSDTIDQFWAMLRQVLGTDGTIAVEVVDLTANGGVVPQPTLSTVSFSPSSDLFVAGGDWQPGVLGPFTGDSLSTATAKYQGIDSTVLTPGPPLPNGMIADNTEFVANFFGKGYDFAVQYAGPSGAMLGRWVTRVRTRALVAQYYDFATPPGNVITPYMWIGGRRFWGSAETVVAAQGVKEVVFDWFVDPSSGLPWTNAAVSQFDPGYGSSYGMGWVCNPTGSSNNLTAILLAEMIVESAATDPRLAIGSSGFDDGFATLQGPGWFEVALRDTDTAAPTTVSLTAGHEYLFNVRRTRGQAKLGLSRLESPDGALPGPPFWTSCQPTLDEATRRVTDLNDESNRAYAVVLANAGTPSADSQPYATASPLDGTDSFSTLNEYFQNSPVDSAHSMRQQFEAPSTDDYGWLYVLAAQVSEASDGDLTIQVRDSGTDVAVGAPFVITSADLGDPRHSWQKIGVRNSGLVSLVATTSYYFDITSTATAPKGWLVQVVNSLHEPPPYGPPAGSYLVNHGGDVNELILVDPSGPTLTTQREMDAVVSIATIPDTPTGFAVGSHSPTCNIDFLPLTWIAYPDPACSTFASYEIQRQDIAGGPWLTVARITDQAVTEFIDYESLRNRVASYRMRVWRADGAPSDWTATVTGTAALTEAGLVFTSNFLPDSSLFYTDLNDKRTYSFPSNFEVFQPIGQNMKVVYGELVDRGRDFKTTVLVRTGVSTLVDCPPDSCVPAGSGTEVFLPIRDLARASLPYVCVHNDAGDRWFANVRTPSGDWRQHGLEQNGGWSAYTMAIEVLELTDTPSAPDAEAVIV